MKKYALIENSRKSDLYQIQALRDFTTSARNAVEKGDLGGFVSGEHNLCQEGNCWVANSTEVWDQTCVYENAYLGGFSSLSDQVQLYGNAKVIRGEVSGNVKICGVEINGRNHFYGNTRIIGINIIINDRLDLRENAFIQFQNDFLQTKMFSDFMEYLTAYKTENGFEIRYN